MLFWGTQKKAIAKEAQRKGPTFFDRMCRSTDKEGCCMWCCSIVKKNWVVSDVRRLSSLIKDTPSTGCSTGCHYNWDWLSRDIDKRKEQRSQERKSEPGPLRWYALTAAIDSIGDFMLYILFREMAVSLCRDFKRAYWDIKTIHEVIDVFRPEKYSASESWPA